MARVIRRSVIIENPKRKSRKSAPWNNVEFRTKLRRLVNCYSVDAFLNLSDDEITDCLLIQLRGLMRKHKVPKCLRASADW